MRRRPQRQRNSGQGIGLMRGMQFLRESQAAFHDLLINPAQRLQSELDYNRNILALKQAEHDAKARDAALGTLEDAKRLGMVMSKDEPGGCYLGRLNGSSYLTNPTDKHVMVVGLAGSGKTTRIVYPMMIGLGMGEHPESVVCTDIKGEIWGSTAEGRSKVTGLDPIVINPWGMYGVPSTRLNPFEDLKLMVAKGLPIKDATLSKINTFHPLPDSKGANAWIGAASIRISSCVLGHLVECEPERACPATMADISTFSQREFADLMRELKQSPACGGWVADVASKLLDQYGEVDDPKYFEWTMEDYASVWEMYGKGSVLREETMETDFDCRKLAEAAHTIYELIPPRYLTSHAKHFAVLNDVLIDIVASTRGPVRTSFILDEFVQLPKAKNTVQALRLYRSAGVRLIVFAQDREGFSKYKDDGGYKVFEENSIGLYWGLRDGSHMRDLQERAGYRYELVSGLNASVGERLNGGGHSGTQQQVPILPVSQIGQIADGEAILEVPGQKIFVVERPFWKDLPFCNGLIRDLYADPLPEIDHL